MPPVYIYVFRHSGYPHIYIVPRSANPEHPCASAQSQILLSISRTHRAGCMASNFSRIHDGPSDNACIYIITDGVSSTICWLGQTNQESLRQRIRDPPAPELSSGIQIPKKGLGQVMSVRRKTTKIYVSSSRNSLVT